MKKPNNYRVKDIQKFAIDNGLRVVTPLPNELQIDIDSDADLVVFNQHIAILREQFACNYEITPSRRKPEGKHIVVTVDGIQFSDIQRVALQAALGSDRKRELLSALSIHRGEKFPTILFEK